MSDAPAPPWRISTLPDVPWVVLWIVCAPLGVCAAWSEMLVQRTNHYDASWTTKAGEPGPVIGTIVAFALTVYALWRFYPPLEGGADWVARGRGKRRVRIRVDEVTGVARERAHQSGKELETESYTITTSDRRTIRINSNASARSLRTRRISTFVGLAIDGAAAKAAAHAADGHPFRSERGYVLQPDRVQLPDGTAIPYASIGTLVIEQARGNRWASVAHLTDKADQRIAKMPDEPVFLKALVAVAKIRSRGLID